MTLSDAITLHRSLFASGLMLQQCTGGSPAETQAWHFSQFVSAFVTANTSSHGSGRWLSSPGRFNRAQDQANVSTAARCNSQTRYNVQTSRFFAPTEGYQGDSLSLLTTLRTRLFAGGFMLTDLSLRIPVSFTFMLAWRWLLPLSVVSCFTIGLHMLPVFQARIRILLE